MKAALRRHDIDGALQFIAIESREGYREMFNTPHRRLARIGRRAHRHQAREERTHERRCSRMLRVKDGKTYSHFVLFVRDYDGIWRVKFF
jgi:hypothetical protein